MASDEAEWDELEEAISTSAALRSANKKLQARVADLEHERDELRSKLARLLAADKT